MTLRLRIPHHATTAYLVGGLTAFYLIDIGERGWPYALASWVATIATVALFALAYLHSNLAQSCRLCRPWPNDQPTRPTYRVALFLGRWSGLALLVAVTGLFIAGPLFDFGASDDDPAVNWRGMLPGYALVSLAALHLATLRLLRLNSATPTAAVHLWNLARERGANLVHHSHWLAVGSLALMLLTTVFLPEEGAGGSLRIVAALLVCGMTQLNAQHGKHLCEQCVEHFLHIDAAARAQRKSWRFTALHRYGRPASAVFILALLVSLWLHGTAYILAIALAVTLMSALIALQRFHGAYLPWCPYCRRGGGGDDDEPAPQPSGSHGRPLVTT